MAGPRTTAKDQGQGHPWQHCPDSVAVCGFSSFLDVAISLRALMLLFSITDVWRCTTTGTSFVISRNFILENILSTCRRRRCLRGFSTKELQISTYLDLDVIPQCTVGGRRTLAGRVCVVRTLRVCHLLKRLR